ncbi:MAG: type IV toxin-antitoxin system AbiEi family antitoxin domain-containing protein, partial [Treponema sp.]|nr:type IV toxin-antitoxin system AbiEi family antitoxin domain-containing protein [Treponema sp.]
METVDKIKEFANRGYFSLSQCKEHEITRYEISQLQNKGLITKVKYGLYVFSDVLEDELFIPQAFSSKIVYSNETALYFEGYSDQVPFTYTVTVPRGYHSKLLWNDFIVRQTPLELFYKGIKEIISPYGNP